MIHTDEEARRAGGAAEPLGLSCGEADTLEIAPQIAPWQDDFCNPLAVREARLWMIREELYGDLDEIRIFAERGMRALEVENDLDLGRAFDQSVKHFRWRPCRQLPMNRSERKRRPS